MLLGHAVPMPVVVRVRTIDEALHQETRQPDPVLANGRRHRDLITLADD